MSIISQEQKKEIARLWTTMRSCDIARKLGLPQSNVRSWGHIYCGAKPKELTQFLKPNQQKYIIDNYATMFDLDIAKHLGVERRLVTKFASDNGLTKDESVMAELRKNHHSVAAETTPEIIELVKEKYATRTNDELYEETGATVEQIRYVAKRFKLRKTDECLERIKEVARKKQIDSISVRRKREADKPKPVKPKPKKETTVQRIRKKKEKRTDYKFVPDKDLIKQCRKDEKPKESKELCIGNRCVCHKKCLTYTKGKSIKYCDSYIYTHKLEED